MNTTPSHSGFSLNWGHGLLGVILLFLVCMSGMIFIASRQTNEMVDDHYYQKELAYQGVIDAGKNLKGLSGQSIVSQSAEKVILQFPVGSFEHLQSGSIDLQRNDAGQKDLHYAITQPGYSAFEISKSDLTKGLYKLKVSWINQEVPYYYEENVFVEK